MCQQCSTKAVSYGEVIPGWNLVRATADYLDIQAGDWGLAVGDDPEVWWPSEYTPVTDPTFHMTPDEMDLMSAAEDEAFSRFGLVVEKIWEYVRTDPLAGHDLVQDAEADGFDRKKHFLSDWLVHRMGLLVESNTSLHNSVELQLEAAAEASRPRYY